MRKPLFTFIHLLSAVLILIFIASCGSNPTEETYPDNTTPNEGNVATHPPTEKSGAEAGGESPPPHLPKPLINESQNGYEPTAVQIICECYPQPGSTDETQRVRTIEELGEIIIAAGNFWEGWWQLNYESGFVINWEVLGDFDDVPAHFISTVYMPLLPASGISSLTEIRDYLLQFYTASWVDAELAREFTPFIEYDNILYVHAARAGFSRPNWDTATHVLVEQQRCLAIVDTTFLHGAWHHEPFGDVYAVEMTHRFIFINGRIHHSGIDPVWGSTNESIYIQIVCECYLPPG